MNKHYLAGLVLAFFMPIIFAFNSHAEELSIEEQLAEQCRVQFILQFQQQYMEQLQAQIEAQNAPEEPEQLYFPTAEERDIAARVIHSEAGNQGYYGMYLVAETIVNRALMSRYPNTVKEVCYQPSQYSTCYTGVTDECYQAFDDACKHLDHKITHFLSGGSWPSYGYRVLEYKAHKFTCLE